MLIHSQGDVIFLPAKSFKKKFLDKFQDKKKNLTLAEGETTGHAHRITKGKAEIYTLMAGLMLLKVMSEQAVISHEEHEDIVLPMGDWVVPIQQEVDHFEKTLRRVAD